MVSIDPDFKGDIKLPSTITRDDANWLDSNISVSADTMNDGREFILIH